MGNLLIALGIGLILAGIALRFGLLSWFGHLPGDFRYEGENFVFFAPLGSMLLISLLASLLFWIVGKFFD
jgi:hypothetical protein